MAKYGGAKIVFEKIKVENMEEYACHKVVRAVKIFMIGIEETEGHGLITPIVPEGSKLTAFIVSKEFVEKHNPQRGGYYVVYEDGYESYSPAEAFEPGYALKDGLSLVDKYRKAVKSFTEPGSDRFNISTMENACTEDRNTCNKTDGTDCVLNARPCLFNKAKN